MGYDVPRAYERLIAPRYALVAEWLLAGAALVPGEEVLELGAGTGLVTRLAAPLVAGRLTATDRSEAMLAVAREVCSARFAVADYEEPLPFPDGRFDVVLSGLTYALDSDAAVAEIARVLRPGGRVALTMWGSDYLELGLVNAARERIGLDPIPPPDPGAAERRLARAGFERITREELELAPEYASVDDYLEYRRGFGAPPGMAGDEYESYLAALRDVATLHANPDGSFTQGWSFALVTAACAERRGRDSNPRDP